MIEASEMLETAAINFDNPDTQCALAVLDAADATEVEVSDCVTQFGAHYVADANAGYHGPYGKIGESDPDGWWRN